MNGQEFKKEAKQYTKADGSTHWEKLESNEAGTLVEAKIVSGPDAGMIVRIESQGSRFWGIYLKGEKRNARQISKEVAAKVAAQLRTGDQYKITFDGGLI